MKNNSAWNSQLIFMSTAFVLLFTVSVFAEEKYTTTVFPIGELFEPLVADPKEPQFSVGFHKANSSGRLGRFNAAVVSYGEHFGLIRWQENSTNSWQLSVVGAVFAQFNMDAHSKDLINADYTIGLSSTHHDGEASYRLRVLHQSTHLGDEFLLSASAPDRINYSLEAMDFTAAYQWSNYRIYGGAGYLLNVEPTSLDRVAIQLGTDFHSSSYTLGNGYMTGGIDLSAYQGDDWKTNTTVKLGLEFGRPGSGSRRIRIMLEGYDGKVPFGQFYDVSIKSYGITTYLLF